MRMVNADDADLFVREECAEDEVRSDAPVTRSLGFVGTRLMRFRLAGFLPNELLVEVNVPAGRNGVAT
jgi:hypothetical protein